MITVTRLNGSQLVINCELIEVVECTPDTVITLTTGKKLIVCEDTETITNKVISYKRLINISK